MPKDPLVRLRKKIDVLDREILAKLNRRSEVVLEIGKIKKARHHEVYAPAREKAVLSRLLRMHRGPFPEHALRAVFGEILSASRSLQSPVQVAYLGPEASFTHVAALKHFGHSTEFVPEANVAKVFDATEKKRVLYGVVPIENSTEGVVSATLDCFLDYNLKIVAEITLPISHHLLTRASSLGQIRRIFSHPQASAQCRGWLEKNLPHVPLMETESTAKAAEKVAQDSSSAAIAGEQAAEIYGLKILRRHLEDSPFNMTRFVVLGPESPKPSGRDKTSLLFSVKDEVGILYRMLEPFFKNHINLTKIESRPLKKKAWEYIFFLDMDGHVREKKIQEAVRGLDKKCLFMKLLGSYPKAS